MKNKNNINILTNKKAFYNYNIIKKIEVGISLKGWEVKSIRKKQINIVNSYIINNKNNIYIKNFFITPLIHTHLNIDKYSNRIKQLLLKKKEINLLFNYINKNNNTIIPLYLYWKKNWIKLIIAISKKKKKYDKRFEIKQKKWNKDKMILFKKNI